MKVLVLGAGGLLGSELVRQLKAKDSIEVIGNEFSEGGVDVTDASAVEEFFGEVGPDVVVNCTAYTDVEGCEDEGYDIAKKVNGEAPGILAEAAKEVGAMFFHFSTDYVFGDNLKDGYDEEFADFKPLNKYGETKLMGEKAVFEVCGGVEGSDFVDKGFQAYLVRVSWLFGRGATNFIAKIMKYAEEKEFLSVVTDEVGCPTYVKDLSLRVIEMIENPPRSGIYHASGEGCCSRNEFAKAILKYAGIGTEVRDAVLADYPRKATIPNVSILKNTKLSKMRNWEEMVRDYIENDMDKG